jgi:predicted house-cleaning NTP pyrophosphatase (Maf/HAM1 superfamily)
MSKKVHIIDNEREHHQVLRALGILDDLEDWKLFEEQELEFERLNEIDIDTYLRYVKINKIDGRGI